MSRNNWSSQSRPFNQSDWNSLFALIVKGAKQPNASNSRDARLSNCRLEPSRSGRMSGKGKNVRWSLCRFQCRPSVFHNRLSSAEDTSSGGRSVNAYGSLLAHFLRAKPPVCISSVSLWTSCRASSTPSQIVARSSTYMFESTLSVSASMFPRWKNSVQAC
ncbi:hypothetical protein T11_8583 [Trichinella zimbabwensis]|uniref:Uncharacterized protein n=1 Tax=Trichinella zimbabwensis TaxID=268475 RepID=A0A0V1GTB6_9BILA|nr:hypothetical protein T11_4006 [Trichinella zimbabwensis]KRZ11307.1 hypothetical protein T11_8583 [Trichinella zimbabwensis]